MKKFIEVLRNPVMTVFLWLLAGACETAIALQAVKACGAKGWACVVMLVISAVLLLIRYKK